MTIMLLSLCVQVEWSHAVVSRADKLSMFLAGIIGAFVAFILLMYAPANSMPFNTAAASQEWMTVWDKVVGAPFNARLNATATSLGLNVTAQPAVKADNPFAISAPLALVAGMLSEWLAGGCGEASCSNARQHWTTMADLKPAVFVLAWANSMSAAYLLDALAST